MHTLLTFLSPLRGPSIGEDTGYLLQGIVHSLCRQDTGLRPHSREHNSMRFEVLTVGLKRIQVFLDNNAESTGKSFSVPREEHSASIFRTCKSKSRLLDLLVLQLTTASSRTAMLTTCFWEMLPIIYQSTRRNTPEHFNLHVLLFDSAGGQTASQKSKSLVGWTPMPRFLSGLLHAVKNIKLHKTLNNVSTN